MSEVKRPNVTGKGPSLVREMFVVFGEINGSLNGLGDKSAGAIKSVLTEKQDALDPLIKRPFMKTVKAGEMAWDCKELSLGVKQAVEAGQEEAALAHTEKLSSELDELVNRIQTFVVRMT